MPEPRKGPPKRKGPPHGRVPSSAVTGFIDRRRIEDLLAPWVPDAGARAFVVRCMLDEGPAHHRGANYALLALLGQLVERAGPPAAAPAGPTAPVPMRLPPHLAGDDDPDAFPLPLPTGALERLARPGTRDLEAMVDCLTDGPPQHALANAAMVCLLEHLLAAPGR